MGRGRSKHLGRSKHSHKKWAGLQSREARKSGTRIAMKDKLLRTTPGRLNRGNSSHSLAIEVEATSFGFTRKSSTSSLRTLRSLGSPSKDEDEDEDEGDTSLSLKRRVCMRLSSLFEGDGAAGMWNKIGSVTSLKTLQSLQSSPEKDLADQSDDVVGRKGTLKKRVGRRLSSMFDVGEKEDRCSRAERAASPPPPPCVRPPQRSDLPICWISVSSSSVSSGPVSSVSADLLSRLSSRVFTRHLARAVLLLLTTQVNTSFCLRLLSLD